MEMYKKIPNKDEELKDIEEQLASSYLAEV
jgi:hypothetical protein